MLHLLDANILINAHRDYYPIDSVPEYWEWLIQQGRAGHVKLPQEVFEEITAGPKSPGKDLLYDWIKTADVKQALVLGEEVRQDLVQRVVSDGYAPDLNDTEIEELGQDPFLIAHALADPASRIVVTAEVSQPKKQRQNRKVPDVCKGFGIATCNHFEMNRGLRFSTDWKRRDSGKK